MSSTLPALRCRVSIRTIQTDRLRRLAAAPAVPEGAACDGALIARIIGVGVETADIPVQEILSRALRDRRAVARYSGSRVLRMRAAIAAARRRLACAGMPHVAWHDRSGRRFLLFQKDSALAQWFQVRAVPEALFGRE